MIRAEILGVPAVTAKLKRIPPDVQLALGKSVGRICLALVRTVKQNKLTGQVLHVRSGRLRRSIHSEVSSTETAVTGIVGTNVEYAAAHEYGFTGTESVRQHLRTITQAFGRAIKGGAVQVQVSAHSRQVNLPERSFLRSALREMAPEITMQLRQAVNNALRGSV